MLPPSFTGDMPTPQTESSRGRGRAAKEEVGRVVSYSSGSQCFSIAQFHGKKLSTDQLGCACAVRSRPEQLGMRNPATRLCLPSLLWHRSWCSPSTKALRTSTGRGRGVEDPSSPLLYIILPLLSSIARGDKTVSSLGKYMSCDGGFTRHTAAPVVLTIPPSYATPLPAFIFQLR